MSASRSIVGTGELAAVATSASTATRSRDFISTSLEGPPIKGYHVVLPTASSGHEGGVPPETLELTKLPCWAELSDEEYRERVAEIVRHVETAAARVLRPDRLVLVTVGPRSPKALGIDP